jgi:hypothetical protein
LTCLEDLPNLEGNSTLFILKTGTSADIYALHRSVAAKVTNFEDPDELAAQDLTFPVLLN